jgi:hypothetical protein
LMEFGFDRGRGGGKNLHLFGWEEEIG